MQSLSEVVTDSTAGSKNLTAGVWGAENVVVS